MGVLHDGRVVEVVVKEILGGGAFGFELRAEGRQAVGRAADIGQGCGAESSYAGAHFVQQIGDQRVQDALDGFVHGELGRGGGVLDENSVVEAAEQWHGFADLGEGKDAGVEAVIEIGGEIGDFVGQIDELGFKGRELVEEVLGQLRVGGGGVIAGVLDDALPYAKGEVEAAKGGVPLLEPRNDAQGVEVVVEAQAVGLEGVVEGLLAGVAKGRMANVVDQCEGLGQLGVEAQGGGQGAGDLGDLEGVGEAAAEVVGGGFCGQAGEDLGLAGEAAKGLGVQNPGGVAGEGSAVGMRGFGVGAAGEFGVLAAADGNPRREFGRRAGLRVRHRQCAREEFTSGYTADGDVSAEGKRRTCSESPSTRPGSGITFSLRRGLDKGNRAVVLSCRILREGWRGDEIRRRPPKTSHIRTGRQA